MANFAFLYLVPIILICSATLKLHGLISSPYESIFGLPILTVLISYFEYTLSFLILNRFKLQTVSLLTSLFFLFGAIYNSVLAIVKEPSCGCFGIFDVNPLWMMIGDSIIYFLLCFKKFENGPIAFDKTLKLIYLSISFVCLSMVGLFSLAENPTDVIGQLKGNKLLYSSYIDTEAYQPGTKKEIKTVIKNNSNKAITINGASSTCKCAVVTGFPIVIEPNKEKNIYINSLSPDKAGKFGAYITLYTDTTPQNIFIKVVGKVKE